MTFSHDLCERILSSEACKSAKTVRLFAAIGSEADLKEAALSLLSQGKCVSYPCITAGTLVFRQITDLSQLIPAGKYEIPEPLPHLPEDVYENALILVPGLVFDTRGYRIGYGGGYYDRYLAGLNETSYTAAGVCFDCQVSEEPLPVTSFDRPVSCIYTPTRELRCPDERSTHAAKLQ